MRTEATMVVFLGKAILVFRFEGKEVNAKEVKININGKQQNPLVIPSSNSSPLLSSILYTRYY